MKNFYNEIKSKPVKRDKNFNKHHIEPNSRLLLIGGSGTGKSNALTNFLDKKRDAFHDIIIFSGSTADEPLYKFLEDKIDGLQLTNDIDEVPELQEWDDEDNDKEKLIVFDDFINLPKKALKKIQDYFIAGRKKGITTVALVQNYKETPKTIARNCSHMCVFKLNDNSTLNNIIRNHNIDDIPTEEWKEFYNECTSEPLNFMMVDLKTLDKDNRLRKNFDVKGGSAKSGWIKKMMKDKKFDINKIKNVKPNTYQLNEFYSKTTFK
jgi:hypothetical protein